MPFMTVGWRAPRSIGALPADPGYVQESPLTVPWTGKVSAYVLPYDVTDLTVRPDQPDPPVIVNPPLAPGEAPPTGAGPAPVPDAGVAPGQVRPASPPRMQIQPRVAPSNFRRRGVRVRLTLAEPARVKAYGQARVVKKLSRRRSKLVTAKLTRTRTVKATAGVNVFFLPPSQTGLRTVRTSRTRKTITVVIATTYSGGRTVTTRQRVVIGPRP